MSDQLLPPCHIFLELNFHKLEFYIELELHEFEFQNNCILLNIYIYIYEQEFLFTKQS